MRRRRLAVRSRLAGALEFSPSIRQFEGFPIGVESSRAVAARGGRSAVLSTFGQRLSPSVPRSLWSMRSWESVALARLARGLPGSHGPSEMGAKERKVDARLTARRPAGCRNVASCGSAGRPRPRSAGQPCRGPDQHGSTCPAAGQGRGLGHNLGQDDLQGTGQPCRGPDQQGSTCRAAGQGGRPSNDLKQDRRRGHGPGQQGSMCHGPGQGGNPAHDFTQGGGPGNDSGQEGSRGPAKVVGLGQAVGSPRGAERWRPRAS
jgi:hypothetical protein